MSELERLGVRVVNGRLGGKGGDDSDEQTSSHDRENNSSAENNDDQIGVSPEQQNSDSEALLDWQSEAYLQTLLARRNSSLGLSMTGDNKTLAQCGSMSSLGQSMAIDGNPTIPTNRPFAGGVPAAAGEAERHDQEQSRSSGMELGCLAGGGLGLSANANQ